MASLYEGMDWSTFKPLEGPGSWKKSGRAAEAWRDGGPAWQAFRGGPDSWEAFLRQRMSEAYEDQSDHSSDSVAGSYKPWYRDQLSDLENWRNSQRNLINQQRQSSNMSDWDTRFADYNRQQDQRFADFASGSDQRWADAMKQWNIEKTYDIGGTQMSTGQAYQHFLDSQRSTRGSISDLSSAWESSVQGLNNQIGGVHESLQRQFAAQNAMNQGGSPATTQAQGAEGSMKGYRPYRGYSGTGAGFNRKGLRITNLNV